jgi:hypothetical protein
MMYDSLREPAAIALIVGGLLTITNGLAGETLLGTLYQAGTYWPQLTPEDLRVNKYAKTLPPAEFDFPFNGTLLVIELDTEAELRHWCGWGLGYRENVRLHACIPEGVNYPADCTVLRLSDQAMRRLYNRSSNLTMRHELGHCNGWPADHPGAR